MKIARTFVRIGLAGIFATALVGCRSDNESNEPQTAWPQQKQVPAAAVTPGALESAGNETSQGSAAHALRVYAQDISIAQNSRQQETALRQLWKYMSNHNYTYKLKAVSLENNNQIITQPAVAQQPLQVTMTVFQGTRQIDSFTFRPLDNHELTFLTPGGS